VCGCVWVRVCACAVYVTATGENPCSPLLNKCVHLNKRHLMMAKTIVV